MGLGDTLAAVGGEAVGGLTEAALKRLIAGLQHGAAGHVACDFVRAAAAPPRLPPELTTPTRVLDLANATLAVGPGGTSARVSVA